MCQCLREWIALPLSLYVTFALAKISGTDPTLPPGYDERRDPLILRHYHPPFVVLLLSGVLPSKSERVIRSVQLLGALAFTCSILLSYWSISGSTSWPGMLLTSLLALWMIRLMFSSVSFHGWEVVWTTTTAALMGRWLGVRKRALGVLLCASLALAVLTLETGLLVWAGAILCLAIWRARSSGGGGAAFRWCPFAVGILLMVLFVMVVWPGSVIKASLLKIPALYAYRIWLGEECAGVPGLLAEHLRSLLPGSSWGLWLASGSFAFTAPICHAGDPLSWWEVSMGWPGPSSRKTSWRTTCTSYSRRRHAQRHSCFDCYNTWLNENRAVFDLRPDVLSNFWRSYLRPQSGRGR